jgi:capsular exopolysaccharide synthesis family protein
LPEIAGTRPGTGPPLGRSDARTARFADTLPTVPASSSPEEAGGMGYGAGYGTYGSYRNPDAFHLVDYLRVLYRHRRVVGTAFVLIFSIVMLHTFTATPLYDARAQILIENENPNVVKFDEVFRQNKDTDDYYQTQYRILQSRLLARRTLEAEQLWNNPVFAPKSGGFPVTPQAWIGVVLSFTSNLFAGRAKPGAHSADETAAQSGVIDAFLSGLTIAPVRNSRLVDVKYQSTDRVMSARIANALAKQYIDQTLDFKFKDTQQATEFLKQRMGEERSALEQRELALQKYREQNDAVSLEDRQNIVVQRLADVNTAVTKARTERIQKEGAWNQIRGIQNDRAALEAHPLVLTNAFIQQLKGELAVLQQQQAQLADRLGDRHPEMVKVRAAISTAQTKLDTEIAKVVQAIHNDYDAAVAQEQSLSAALEQQKREALALNRQSIQYGALQRDAASSREIFQGLLQRSKETGIQGELRTSNIRIVDLAEVPAGPSSPNKVNNVLYGFFGGSLCAVGLGFFFEYLDNRIKSPEEIKRHLGLPFLGLVPALRPNEVSGAPLVNAGVPSQFAEAFRTIRTNVLFSSAEDGPRSIVVTSTMPGEGKSVVSSNVAISLAFAGQTVLLIDADMRRPQVHSMFGIPQEPGLSNAIVGTAPASEAIQRTAVPNLWVLPAGRQPPNPAELLGSRRFREFLSSLGKHFTWVIVDSPPVLAVTDSSVVSHLVNGVIFVVGAEMTGRTAAKTALDQLDGAKAKYLGAVLNKVDLRKNGYYYSHYYQRSYRDYYVGAAERSA